MKGIIVKLSIHFDDIKELRKTKDKKTIITFKSGDILTFNNGEAKRIFKILQRTFSGEHLD